MSEKINACKYQIYWPAAGILVELDWTPSYEDEFVVTCNPDTIKYDGYSNINVTAFDENGDEYNPWSVTVELDENGEKYGSLVDCWGSYLPPGSYAFSQFQENQIRYHAEIPLPKDTPITIQVIDDDNPTIVGSGTLCLKAPRLHIISPPSKKIYRIDGTPTMPSINCTAQLLNNDFTDTYPADWACKVMYDFPPRADSKTFTEVRSFDSNSISEWDLNFNNNETIIGGDAIITVSTKINNIVYSDSVKIYIRGNNPDKPTVINGLSNGIEALVETESAKTYHQFGVGTYAVPNESLPLNAGGDWGMCQINKCNGISTAVLWDWTANLSRAQELFNQWISTALTELQAQAPPNTDIPQLVLDCQTYAHYQGGTIAGAYIWETDSTGAGLWTHNPTNADGNASWVINGNTNYKNNWGN